MTEIENAALTRAQNYLRGIGAKWAIQLADGTVMGELQIQEPKRPRARSNRPLRDFVGDTRYDKALSVLEPGGLWEYTTNQGFDYADGLEATVRAWCNARWGQKTYIMTLEEVPAGWKLSVLRG